MAKNKIRITESELKQIVTESVKKVLSERIKAEKGMTDDEVISRCMDNYHKDRFADRNIFDKHFSEPSIEDYTPEPEEGWYEYFNRQRRLKHLGKQNRKR